MTTQKPKRVTLADVARAAGVSNAAVSLILNDKPGSRLSEETSHKVKQVAAELGYRANPAAQSLRLGKTKTLGFISDNVTVTRYASGMITGILRTADRLGHTVLISETFGSELGLGKAVEQLRHREVDGLILGFMDSRARNLSVDFGGLPVVLVNSLDPAIGLSVMPDEADAGERAVKRIVESGVRNVAVIGHLQSAQKEPASYPSITRRMNAIYQGLKDSNIEIIGEWLLEEWNPDDGYKATARLLESELKPDAIICANDRVAMGVYQALMEKNLEPGKDISVLSFDDEDIADYLRPGLTTMRLPYEEMGSRAVALLLEEAEILEESMIYMPLIERESIVG
ncbi:LacI family transcriptional regulator [Glutamicibacter uratoxydans]|uniref:LacI family transcriptional regulator n=1 Tax=Glutamicibacter uratoxydans TaxID=43667 RepID=A0A4Y4DRF0_GLUUR|nr:LacI family DNA-binding transcriptional regulator [Glutamicibacter uratoxydans]GED07922.1 LacI family transcriptional regulator [Glutamicibacter uratoxydans]